MRILIDVTSLELSRSSSILYAYDRYGNRPAAFRPISPEKRTQITKECKTMCCCMTNFATLNTYIERHLEELQVAAEPVKATVAENASAAQFQETYLKK